MTVCATNDYYDFLERKTHIGSFDGFDPVFMPSFLFDFQKDLLDWSIRKGRSAIFADCGLGKTPMQLVWAENIVRKTNGRVLILTPLAVSRQTVAEGEKFGIECRRSDNGKPLGKITVTNYERLHHFNADDYIGVVCDESSILKNFDGTRKRLITSFLLKRPYRLLCTATAAPNDYVELGTTSEAIGELGYMDMLGRFFRNVDGSTMGGSHGFRFKHKDRLDAYTGKKSFWRFKKHAEPHFWRWVCSWARVVRKPSDLGYDDGPFHLPPLIEQQNVIENQRPLPGYLFVRPAVGLQEQRQELRATLAQRCEMVADLVSKNGVAVVWCNLNDEGNLLENIIKDCGQVSGSDSDQRKEELLAAFSAGELRVLITKPKIAGFGLNWQHCAHMTVFPSHSFESYYQSIRRCWRFGQTKPVTVDVVTTKGGLNVLANLQRKAAAADKMFTELIRNIGNASRISTTREFELEERIPSWL